MRAAVYRSPTPEGPVDTVFENAPDPRGFAGSPRTEQKEALGFRKLYHSGVHIAILPCKLEASTQKTPPIHRRPPGRGWTYIDSEKDDRFARVSG